MGWQGTDLTIQQIFLTYTIRDGFDRPLDALLADDDAIRSEVAGSREGKQKGQETLEKTMKIVSIAVSAKKGTRKTQVETAELCVNHGVLGDGHAGTWERQVSFLAAERIEECKARGLNVTFGDFAENVATEGIDWKIIPLGSRFRLGDHAIVEITKIGKECHKKCAIYYQAGDCIMPREGVFARVLQGGTIRCGDQITPLPLSST